VASDDPTSDDSDDSVAELLPEDPPQAEADLLPDDPAENLGTEDLAPDPPTVPDTSTNEVDADLKKRFWSLVLVFNVALFGMSLGAMLVGFRGRWEVGGAIFAVGAFAFLRGWWGYRQVSAEAADSEETDDSKGEDNGGDSDDASADTTDRSADDSVQKD
jgi:hypothetical protein